MHFREVINFCLLLIISGLLEFALFGEKILGLSIAIFGLVGLIGELFAYEVTIS